MANVTVLQIDSYNGYTRLGGSGTVYADVAAAMAAAEAAADALIVSNGSGTKVVNNTSNRVYVVVETSAPYEQDINPGDSPGDGVTFTYTQHSILCKWWVKE